MKFLLPLFFFISLASFASNAPSPRFVRNDGQWDIDILYRAAIPGGFLFLKKNSLVYVFYHTGDVGRQHLGDTKHSTPASRQDVAVGGNEKDRIRAHGFEVSFQGASASTQLEGKEEYTEKRNYFLGKDHSRWASNVAAFAEIMYKDIYPSINLRLFAQNGTFKYEFHVAAQANPEAIQMKYKGMSQLKLDNGFLLTETSVNKVTETPPYTYQLTNKGIRHEIASSFTLNNNVVSFSFPKGYNRRSAMVIDPVLVFATYSGSYTDNWGYTATYDKDGNLYSGGIEFGTRFPATIGAFSTAFSGMTDVAILKYNPNLKGDLSLIYATYLGGSETEMPESMITTSTNELIILGVTSSTDFPVTSDAYDQSFNGGIFASPVRVSYSNGSDLFVAKLNASASTLVGSTYLGGSSNDGLNQRDRFDDIGLDIFNYGDQLRGEVNLDAQENIYIASTTLSSDFPLINASQTQSRGSNEVVVCEFNPTLSNLVWSTYLGGNGFDAARGIRIASSGTVYITGGTSSSNLPSTQGVIKQSLSGREDGFVASFQNQKLTHLSYMGTSNSDQSYLIDIDPNENVYVFGLTLGEYTITSGTFNQPSSGQFIHALDKTFSKTLFSTVIGGGIKRPEITPTAFMRSACGFLYLAGWGGDVNTFFVGTVEHQYLSVNNSKMPTTPNSLNGPKEDSFYLAILNENASQLLYGTFFGSPARDNHVDGGTSRFSPDGTIYHAVCACRDRNTFPVTIGAYSDKNHGELDSNNTINGCNNAAFKINLDNLEADFTVSADSCGSPRLVQVANLSEGASQYQWLVNGQVVSSATSPQLTLNGLGEFTITLKAYNPLTCKKVDSVSKSVVVSGTLFTIMKDSVICAGESIQLGASGGVSYEWSPSVGMDDPQSANPIVKPTQPTTYTVVITDKNGCTKTLSTTVSINTFEPDFDIITSSECGGQTRVRLINKLNGSTAEWQLIDSLGVVHPISDTLSLGIKDKIAHYQIVLRALLGHCEEIVTKDITINPVNLPVNIITNHPSNSYFETYRQGWKVEIVDQWGRPVYTDESYQNDWHATNVKNAIYYYKLTSPDGASCRGWLQVIR
ncbi:gliding motility-associated C-terminal domain-containing protein [Cytophagaceae bacterium YF14B1]|uniref:Gliding motility-associated C-terminal domain-containing protein n=1 Tax=Xanthocytophaga flava TaxID=3048013 RepID=A0AAE3QRE1_9BACT|nr:gliding motility-associated C-terminal domain-containing protein [Xanthocytophaga flavus]MDJ1481464.1 gliding motility-associated C-terminal domain-containing protein [Xanthocytophaga flavus]